MLTSSSHVSNNGSYSNDRGAGFEAEYAVDPASGGFFHTDFKKHDDLKEMLDSNKDSLKLEAMKRIIGVKLTHIWADPSIYCLFCRW
jgi:AP-3 complex subunit beta